MSTIDSFSGRNKYLSNFSSHGFHYGGVWCRTSEHAFQAMKSTNREDFLYVIEAESPGQAKRRGRKIECRADWRDVKIKIMFDIVKCKFDQNTDIKAKLLTTRSDYLIEDNNWQDKEWGMTKENGKWVGRNALGKILMVLRIYYIAQDIPDVDPQYMTELDSAIRNALKTI